MGFFLNKAFSFRRCRVIQTGHCFLIASETAKRLYKTFVIRQTADRYKKVTAKT